MEGKIPYEIILDIFSRLDIKSLCRVRFACKAWRNMMDDDPCFLSMHLRRMAKLPGVLLLITPMRNSTIYHALDEHEDVHKKRALLQTGFVGEAMMTHFRDPNSFRICGSVHGLLCFVVNDSLVLSNPLLKQSITLPRPTLDSRLQSYGMGFDSKSNTYKIVHVINNHDAEVYTLGTDSWRKISGRPRYRPHGNPVFFDGVLHWIAPDQNSVITSFDLAAEVFYITPCPPSNVRGLARLIELEGFLAMVDQYSDTGLQVWYRKDFAGIKKWVRKCRIDLSNVISTKAKYTYNDIQVLGMLSNGVILLMTNKAKYTYDPENNKLRRVWNSEVDASRLGTRFRGSLVSPDKLIHQHRKNDLEDPKHHK